MKDEKEKLEQSSKNVMMVMGARNFAENEREEHDFYATDPKAVELLLDLVEFDKKIWEPACGMGHISKVLEMYGYEVRSTDLVYRGYGEEESFDFLEFREEKWDGDIITNPPFNLGIEFVRKALESINDGNKVAMFVKLQFLEGLERRRLYNDYPPKYIYVASGRLSCARGGKEEYFKSSAIPYIWIVWEKGYQGETVIRWFN